MLKEEHSYCEIYSEN